MLHAVPGVAGILVSWTLTVAVGVWLARRAPSQLPVPRRVFAGFAVAALALYWIALASRQLLTNPDPIHLALAASIQAGNWPPTLPWNPDYSAPYHYAIALLIGLLAPPVGPDLPFSSELLGAYVWTGFILLVGITILKRGGRVSARVLTPLLLTAGAWGLVVFTEVPSILTVLIPIGLPEAGLRATLAAVYLPTVSLPWSAEVDASPANIWRPSFVLAYALAFVALERLVAARGHGWVTTLTLAGLLGFLGLLDEAVALVVLALWILLEAGKILQARRERAALPRQVLPAITGPALASLALAVGGGVVSGVLTGAAGGGLSLGWIADLNGRHAVGSFGALAGGLGIVGLGPAVIAGVGVVLARRDLLPLALAGASAGFLLAAFTVQYDFAEHDVVRFDGHARNFALLALLVALGTRLSGLELRWRLAVAALLALVVTWPTVAAPVRGLGSAVGHGVQIGNARAWATTQAQAGWSLAGREVLNPFGSNEVATWIRQHTAPDARILSPNPYEMSANTGRSNAAGFTRFVHLFPQTGPEFEDAITQLEPAAMRRLGITHVHAPSAWAASLPERAATWLADSANFELVARDDSDALYRVLPAFSRLASRPAAGTFESLRQALPDGSTVYLARDSDPLSALQVASALPHARLLGDLRTEILHPLTRIDAEPIGDETPDFIVTSMQLTGAIAASNWSEPFWWNDKVLVFATDEPRDALMGMPPASRPSVTLSDLLESDQGIEFTATFTNPTDDRWTGQDWLVIERNAALIEVVRNLRTGPFAQWFDGQISPMPGATSFDYQFNAKTRQLAVRNDTGTFTVVRSSGRPLEPGIWILAMRVHDSHRKAHFFPVLEFEMLPGGGIRYGIDGAARANPERS